MNDPICYYNGVFIPQKECTINITDLGFQRGYGIFDFFRSRNGTVLRLDDYLKRLFNSVKDSGINISLTKPLIESIIQELQKQNNFKNSAFKIIVTGGNSNDCATYENTASLIVLNIPFKKFNSTLYKKGASLITYNYSRPEPKIKTLNYYTSLKLQKLLRQKQAIDVLYYDKYISETARSNIFLIKNNILYTPKNNILLGITRAIVLELAIDYFEVKVTDIPINDLFDFDEIFISSTAKEIMPIVEIDGKKIGNHKIGEVTKILMKSFHDKVSVNY